MALRKWLLYLLVFSIPFLTISPRQQVLGLQEGVAFGMLAALVMVLYSRELVAALVNIIPQSSPWPVLVFIAVMLFSFLWLVVTGKAMRENYVRIAYFVFSGLVCWLAYVVVEDGKDLGRIVQVYLAAAVVAALYGVYVTLGFMLGLHTGQEALWTVPRLAGTGVEAQVFGNFLLSVLPLTLGLYLFESRQFPDLALLSALGMFILVLVMTFSAGAWVGAAVGLVPLALLVRELRWQRVLAVLAVVGLVALLLLSVNRWVMPGYLKAFESISVKFTQKAPGKELPSYTYQINMNSVNDRKWFREAAWKMFRTHPLTGVGFGNFGYQYNNYRPADAPYYNIYARAHNQYLEILAETGIIGFAAFLLLVGHLIIMFYRVLAYCRNRSLMVVTISLFATLVALAVHGWSLGILVHNYVWFVLGLTYAACRLSLSTQGGIIHENRD